MTRTDILLTLQASYLPTYSSLCLVLLTRMRRDLLLNKSDLFSNAINDVCEETLPTCDLVMPAYPTINIMVCGGDEGTFRINMTDELLKYPKLINAILFKILCQIFVPFFVTKTLQTNIILHPKVIDSTTCKLTLCCLENFEVRDNHALKENMSKRKLHS